MREYLANSNCLGYNKQEYPKQPIKKKLDIVDMKFDLLN